MGLVEELLAQLLAQLLLDDIKALRSPQRLFLILDRFTFIWNRWMAQIGSLGKARCEVRCGASGKRRNAADGPIWRTEGLGFHVF